MPSKRNLALLAAALLLSLGGAVLEESFVHTDDGCPVEIHCVACRLTVGTTAVAPTPFLLPTVRLVALDFVAPAPRPAHDNPFAERALSRGPPLS